MCVLQDLGRQLNCHPRYQHLIRALAIAVPRSSQWEQWLGKWVGWQLPTCGCPRHTCLCLNEISDLERQVVGHLYEFLLLKFHS